MRDNDEWSPDEPMGSEAFEPGDEALDDGTSLDPELAEMVQVDPSLDPSLQVDERELEEVGADLDDPEVMVTLDGGGDDPDGFGEPAARTVARRGDGAGWGLDEPGPYSDDPDADPDADHDA